MAMQVSNLMRYLNSNLAREVGRLADWSDGIWSRRYQAIVVSSEEEAQVARLKYILGHGVKEELTERPRDWPGVHAAKALVDGEPIQGYWFSRTQEYAARQRGEKFDRLQYATLETIALLLSPAGSTSPRTPGRNGLSMLSLRSKRKPPPGEPGPAASLWVWRRFWISIRTTAPRA